MAGKRGMTPAAPRRGAVRNKIWRSMRILRRFTTADLCRTSGASVENTRKFIRRLAAHGYVAPAGAYVGGRPGDGKGWRLVRDCGPHYPMRCEVCGRPLGELCGGGEEAC